MQHGDLTRQRKQQAMALSNEARGGHLNLGKKISVPKDIMMEELNLPSTRGSRMFQERMKRAEMFTVENTANAPTSPMYPPPPRFQHPAMSHIQMPQHAQVGKENVRTEIVVQPRKMLVTTLDHTVAKKGAPNVLAPGYSGPLKEMPPEKFNVTVIPQGYCSPWREALGPSSDLHSTLNIQLPDPPLKRYLTHYRCFNRAPVPFSRTAEAPRLIPVPRPEVLETHNEPIILSPQHLATRPTFNRAPRGWGLNYNPESNEL